MGIIHGGIIETIPFREIQFHLVPLIQYSAIAKRILVRSLIFDMFTLVENQPLNQRLKQKLRIMFKNLQNNLSFVKLQEHFLFCKNTILYFYL